MKNNKIIFSENKRENSNNFYFPMLSSIELSTKKHDDFQALDIKYKQIAYGRFWSIFPEDLGIQVCSFLKERDLIKLSRVSSSWRKISNDNRLWKTLFLNKFPNLVTQELNSSSWKNHFENEFKKLFKAKQKEHAKALEIQVWDKRKRLIIAFTLINTILTLPLMLTNYFDNEERLKNLNAQFVLDQIDLAIRYDVNSTKFHNESVLAQDYYEHQKISDIADRDGLFVFASVNMILTLFIACVEKWRTNGDLSCRYKVFRFIMLIWGIVILKNGIALMEEIRASGTLLIAQGIIYAIKSLVPERELESALGIVCGKIYSTGYKTVSCFARLFRCDKSKRQFLDQSVENNKNEAILQEGSQTYDSKTEPPQETKGIHLNEISIQEIEQT